MERERIGGRGPVVRAIEAVTAAGFVVDTELRPVRGTCGPCHEDGNCPNLGRDGNENTDDRKINEPRTTPTISCFGGADSLVFDPVVMVSMEHPQLRI